MTLHIQFLGRCLSARFCTWDIFVYQQPFSVYAYHRPTYLDVDRLKLMGPDILLKGSPPNARLQRVSPELQP